MKRTPPPTLAKNVPLNERPSYLLRPTLERIGRKWRALYGDNPQDGVAGFGDTPHEAFVDFDRYWFTHRGPSAFRGNVVIDEPVRIIRRHAKGSKRTALR